MIYALYQNPNHNQLLPPSHIAANHIKPRLIQHSLEDLTLAIQQERNTILWHDPNISSPQNQKMYHVLDLIANLKGFDDCEKVIQYLQENKVGRFSVLTAGTKGEILTKSIAEFPNVSAVYVFCGNVPFHQTWAQQYPKVKLVASDPMQLIAKIFQDLKERVLGYGSVKIDLPVFLECFEAEKEKEYKIRNSQFNKIITMEDQAIARKDLLYLMKHIMTEGHAEIERFEAEYVEYDAEKILKWYTESELIGKMTSNCLKQGSPDAVYYGRFLLRDLEKAINEQYWKSSKEFQGNVYRNVFVTEEQWKKIKENEGKEIAFVDFFRASKNKEESIQYLKLGLGLNMHVNIKVEGLTKEQGKGLAELKDFSNNGANLEVVFSAFSRFTIQKVSSSDIEGHEDDRELQLIFGGVPQGQPPAPQDCIVFAQCMNCFAILETGFDEKIDPSVHYTCNKCPAGGLEKLEVPKDNELDLFEEHPVVHKSLLGKEIDIADIKPTHSLYASHIPVLNPGVFQPNYDVLKQEIDWKNLIQMESVLIPAAGMNKQGKPEELEEFPIPIPVHLHNIQKPQEEFKAKEEEEDYSVIIKEISDEIPAAEKEEKVNGAGGGQQVKVPTTDGDDEEEDEEEDEDHERLIELYVRAKEEFEMNNYKEAMVLYEEILKNPGKLDKVLLGKCQKNLDVCYEKEGGDEKKVEKLLKVLENKKKSLGRDHPEVKATYKELAGLFTKLSVVE